MAKISFIIPVYNTSKYLDDCMTSVMGQTYEDLEIILIDDGSTDGISPQICDDYASLTSASESSTKRTVASCPHG